MDFPCGSGGKASDCSAGDPGLMSGVGKSPEEGNGNPLQYSCLENPMDRGAWQAIVHGVSKSQMQLSTYTFTPILALFPGGLEGKPSACNAGDLGSIPGSGRSPAEGNGTPLQYFCLENPVDRVAS